MLQGGSMSYTFFKMYPILQVNRDQTGDVRHDGSRHTRPQTLQGHVKAFNIVRRKAAHDFLGISRGCLADRLSATTFLPTDRNLATLCSGMCCIRNLDKTLLLAFFLVSNSTINSLIWICRTTSCPQLEVALNSARPLQLLHKRSPLPPPPKQLRPAVSRNNLYSSEVYSLLHSHLYPLYLDRKGMQRLSSYLCPNEACHSKSNTWLYSAHQLREAMCHVQSISV